MYHIVSASLPEGIKTQGFKVASKEEAVALFLKEHPKLKAECISVQGLGDVFSNNSEVGVFASGDAFLLLDMEYKELEGVPEDYDDPEEVEAIQWIVAKSSYDCRDNGQSGVYDYLYNLANLEWHLETDPPAPELAKQLAAVRERGYSYILFNQGC